MFLNMFFVTRKKYDLMIQSYARVQRQYDDLVKEHMDLIQERDGQKIGMQTLRAQVQTISDAFYLFKKNHEKEI